MLISLSIVTSLTSSRLFSFVRGMWFLSFVFTTLICSANFARILINLASCWPKTSPELLYNYTKILAFSFLQNFQLER